MPERHPSRLLRFDASRYLDSDEMIAEYLTAVLDEDDPELLLRALSDVARAKGMTAVAGATGLGRESLYKALAPGAKPRYETVLKVLAGLGVKLRAESRITGKARREGRRGVRPRRGLTPPSPRGV